MLQLVARLGLNARGFLTGLAESESRLVKFARFAGTHVAGGVATVAGEKLGESIFERMFGKAKAAAHEIPGVPAISKAADTIQPVVDPLGLKRKMGLALGAAAGVAGYIGTKGVAAIAQVKDLSEQMDRSTTSVQKLQRAAASSGLDIGNFQNALAAGANTRKDAAESNEKLRKTYKELGVSLEDLQNPGKDTLDLMKQIVGTNDTSTEGFRARWRDLFGKGSEKLIEPVKNIDKAMGIIISERSVNAVDRLAKAFDRTKMTIMAAFGEVTGATVDKFFQKLEDKNSLLNKAYTVARALGVAGKHVAQAALEKVGIDVDFSNGSTGKGAAPSTTAMNMREPSNGPALYEDQIAQQEEKKVQELKEQIHEAELRGLDNDKRRIELARDRLEIEAQIQKMRADNAKESDVKALELKKAQVDAEIAIIDREKQTTSVEHEKTRDELAKVGGFNASTESLAGDVWVQIRDYAAAIAENTRPDAGDGW